MLHETKLLPSCMCSKEMIEHYSQVLLWGQHPWEGIGNKYMVVLISVVWEVPESTARRCHRWLLVYYTTYPQQKSVKAMGVLCLYSRFSGSPWKWLLESTVCGQWAQNYLYINMGLWFPVLYGMIWSNENLLQSISKHSPWVCFDSNLIIKNCLFSPLYLF